MSDVNNIICESDQFLNELLEIRKSQLETDNKLQQLFDRMKDSSVMDTFAVLRAEDKLNKENEHDQNLIKEMKSKCTFLYNSVFLPARHQLLTSKSKTQIEEIHKLLKKETL